MTTHGSAHTKFEPKRSSSAQFAHDTLNGVPHHEEQRASPSYRFGGVLPAALMHLRDEPDWVAWKYEQRNGRSTKPPVDPRTGRYADVSNPATWGSFDAALAVMGQHGLAGVGLVLTGKSDIVGIDLDHCITDAGSYSPLAAEVLEFGETYAEVSPSGEGIRILARGELDSALKDDAGGIEVYSSGRYLTITGQHIGGTPQEIREAPRTIARLREVVAADRVVAKAKANRKARASASPEDFFANVNAVALARLDTWVPALHPTAHQHPNSAWRITSHNLGRNLEEDLAYHPEGIRDHGEEHGLTPIDAVLRYGGANDAKAAAFWLCQRVGVEPSALGSKAEAKERLGARAANGSADPGTASGGTQKNSGHATQAQGLIAIATRSDVEVYHSPDRTPYADITIAGHRETWPLRSRGFKFWLRGQFYRESKTAPNSDAISTAMGVLEAMALFNGRTREVNLRIAAVGDDRVYLDLCDEQWRQVEITRDGWRITDSAPSPVRFRRTAGMLALPTPQPGGSIDDLRQFINIGGDGNEADNDPFVLIVSFLLAALRGRGPFPVLGLSGEQGTGKSLLLDLIRRLIDPNVAALRSLPRDVRDVFIAAINSSILCFDNLSSISPEVSDALCRISTGGGFGTRQLYSDDDEYLVDVMRPIALNGIVDVASRSDLADRLLAAKLGMIEADKRKTERELRKAFDVQRPGILGALLDAVGKGLGRAPDTSMNRLPRMADFALWIRACELGGLWPVGTHMAAYERNRGAAAEMVVESDPVATALQRHMEKREETTTTATELLAELEKLVPENGRRGPQWPGNARALSGRLTRVAPALRHLGISITASREGNTGRRLIHIRRR